MERLLECLRSMSLLALGDVHSNNNARTLTQRLIESGEVKVLFIEWPNFNQLNEAIELMILEGLDQSQASMALRQGQYFATLSKSDASPSLLELTAIAISHRVKVAACDLSADQALSRIFQLRQIEEYDAPKDTVLFDDEGLAVRDDYAVTQIDKYSKLISNGRLILWGDNHFKDYENRYLKPRHHLLEPSKRFDVLPNNLLKKLKTTRSIFDILYIPNTQINT